MENIICIGIYLMFVLIIMVECKHQYQKCAYYTEDRMVNKIKTWQIIVFSILFTLLNRLCTSYSSNAMGGDRQNYALNFYGYRETPSVVLKYIIRAIHLFSNDVHMLFYFTTFVCMMLLFLSYKIADDADYRTVFFLLCTNIVFFSFTGLKQIYACVFASLFFAVCLQKNSIRRNIICVGCIILAILSHSTGYILVPIFIFILLFEHKKMHTFYWCPIFMILLIFMQPILVRIANIVSSFLPSLSGKIMEYFAEDTVHAEEGSVFAFLKGMPFYILALWGGMNRKRLRLINKNYDVYYLLTLFGAFFGLATMVSYWMSRFTYIFYLPMGIMFSILMKYTSRNNRLIFGSLIISSLLFFTLRSVVLIYVNYGGY